MRVYNNDYIYSYEIHCVRRRRRFLPLSVVIRTRIYIYLRTRCVYVIYDWDSNRGDFTRLIFLRLLLLSRAPPRDGSGTSACPDARTHAHDDPHGERRWVRGGRENPDFRTV